MTFYIAIYRLISNCLVIINRLVIEESKEPSAGHAEFDAVLEVTHIK